MNIQIKYTKNLSNVLNQNQRDLSIMDNLCLLQLYKWNTINAPNGSNFMTILGLFIIR